MLNDSVLLRLRLPPFAPFFADFFAGVFAILFFFFCVCVYINILKSECVCVHGGGVVCACGRKHTLCYVDKDCLVEHCKHRTIHIFPRQWYSYVNRFERGRCCGHPNSDRRDRFHGSSLAEILFLYCVVVKTVMGLML